MKTKDGFEEGYRAAVENSMGVLGTLESAEYVQRVQASIDGCIEMAKTEASHRANVPEDYLKGWIAEQWHAGTLRASAAARGRTDIWAEVQGDNTPGQDVRYGDSFYSKVAEVKYYKTGEFTGKAISRPEYDASEKIVPSDQKQSVVESARRLAEKNEMNRPEQAAHYHDTANRADDRLRFGNAESKPLTEKDIKELARDLRRGKDIDPEKYGLNTENFVEWSDVARQAGEAGLHAFAFSAALKIAPHVWNVLERYINKGEVDIKDIVTHGEAVLLGAGTSGLRGGIAAGFTAACKSGLMGNVPKHFAPAAIGMATTLAINAIGYAVQLQQGCITQQEFSYRCVRDIFVLTSGFSGATVGQWLIPFPIVGALAGNLIGSTLGAFAFAGVNSVVLGMCIESGWTYFGLVKQDYVIPDEILIDAGYELFSPEAFYVDEFPVESFTVDTFTTTKLTYRPIRRGFIACNVVGYV